MTQRLALEKTGLLGGPTDPEVVQLRSENTELRQELQTMRALLARVEAEREQIASAGPIRALRLRRRLRAAEA